MRIPALSLLALTCLLVFTAPSVSHAQEQTAQEKAIPVSAAALAKAKAEVDALRAIPQEARVEYLIKQRENISPATYKERKAAREARRAYIVTLPKKERTIIKNQLLADRKIVRERMKAKWNAMTPEEREAVRARRKAEFDALPEDVKTEIQQNREKTRARRTEKTGDSQKTR